VREASKYGEPEARHLVEAGALSALLECLVAGRGSPAPAAGALGLIGGYTEELADAVVEASALPVLVQGLRLSTAEHVRVMAANSLREICARSMAAAIACGEAGALPVLQALAAQPDDAQRSAAEGAIGAIAPQLAAAGAYEALVEMVEQVSAASDPSPNPTRTMPPTLAPNPIPYPSPTLTQPQPWSLARNPTLAATPNRNLSQGLPFLSAVA
jgi:hypothetical protein